MIRRQTARMALVGLFALVAFAGLVALGTWQVHRRAWKLDLIAQVQARIHAAPVPAPGPAEWPAIDARAAYRRVRIDGRFIGDRQTLVQAATERGAGWWVMTPLRSTEGFVLLVDRGFVAHRAAPPPPGGPVRVTGLLRVSEPGGGFLRANDPAADRWYSRDVAAIARRRGLGQVAPYFIDADATPGSTSDPVGGMTVIAFPNNHLVYALTWYGLAMMVAAAFLIFVRSHRSGRR